MASLSNTVSPTTKVNLFTVIAKQASLQMSSHLINHISDSLLLETIPNTSQHTLPISSFVNTWTHEG